ncbi:2-amino-4-hydroxy-6-hydroxymethyldihydropteridine diphosphokinase [bacterium]|nr:2-amino-4-hydroxy-6-hydroxymethyldihydropteridine diphosphokinase [bacterium]
MEYLLGLGSNLGDRYRHLVDALVDLKSLGIVQSVASIYLTPPLISSDYHGPTPNSYLNTACVLKSELEPVELLKKLLAIENNHGRVRNPQQRWLSRTLDIDILGELGGLMIDCQELKVPHPELSRRDFVLNPLSEIAPNFSILDPMSPKHRLTVIQMLLSLRSSIR